MPLSKEAQLFFQKDRPNGFPKSLTENDIFIIRTFDGVLIPSIELHGDGRPLCQLIVSPKGIFLLGFITLNETGINAAKISESAWGVGGGVIGAALSGGQASELLNNYLKEYQKVHATVGILPMPLRFEKSPICSHFLPFKDIEDLKFPKKGEELIKIETKLGTIEFTSAVSETDAALLRSWWSKKDISQTVEISEELWTIEKALLCIRKNKMMAKDLAAYFYRRIIEAQALLITHEILRYALPFDTFLLFLQEIKHYRTEESDTVCTYAIAGEKRRAIRRIWTGIVMLVCSPVIIYYSNTISPNSAWDFLRYLIIVGGVFAVWGLVRSILATNSLMRCKAFAKTSDAQSFAKKKEDEMKNTHTSESLEHEYEASCSQCGKQVLVDATICPYCGDDLSEEITEE